MRPRAACTIITRAVPSLWTSLPVITLRPEADRTARRRPVWLGLGLATLLCIAPPGAPTPLAAQAANEVQVTPETMTLGVGAKQPIFAAAYDRQGNLIASAKFTFWSSDTTIAKVSREGTVLGIAPGLAKVEARLQGKRASLAVLITGRVGPRPAAPTAGPCSRSIPRTAMLLPGESVRSERAGAARRRLAAARRPGELEVAQARGRHCRHAPGSPGRGSGEEHRAGEHRDRAHGDGAGGGRPGRDRAARRHRRPRSRGRGDVAGSGALAGESRAQRPA